MLMRFKDGHYPHHTGDHLCKCDNDVKIYYKVLFFQKESKSWLHPDTLDFFKDNVVGWVKIRES